MARPPRPVRIAPDVGVGEEVRFAAPGGRMPNWAFTRRSLARSRSGIWPWSSTTIREISGPVSGARSSPFTGKTTLSFLRPRTPGSFAKAYKKAETPAPCSWWSRVPATDLPSGPNAGEAFRRRDLPRNSSGL